MLLKRKLYAFMNVIFIGCIKNTKVMKKVILKTGIIFLILIIMGGGCNKEQISENNQELFGTWKFIAFGNPDGSTRIAQPADCDDCYVITFIEDTTFVGKSVINILGGVNVGGKFSLSSSQLSFPWGVLATFVLEEGDPNLFTEALIDVSSFKIEKTELKLFYSGNKFLLFLSKAE